jgi:drug/metabolite transporter (DMT)-like permease
MGSISTCAVILLALRGAGTVRISRRVVAWVLGTALFDTSGNLAFIAATRAGRLDVAAVLASLYPASTILLAAWMMKERPTRRQGWGMVVAGVAVVLIAG